MVATIALAVVLLLVIVFLVATLRQAVVSGQLSQLFQGRARRLAVERREAHVMSDAIRVKRALDAAAFEAHQQMVRAAQQHSHHQP